MCVWVGCSRGYDFSFNPLVNSGVLTLSPKDEFPWPGSLGGYPPEINSMLQNIIMWVP